MMDRGGSKDLVRVDLMDSKRKFMFLLFSIGAMVASIMFCFIGPHVHTDLEPNKKTGENVTIVGQSWVHTFNFVNNEYSNQFALSFSIDPNYAVIDGSREFTRDIYLWVKWEAERADGTQETFVEQVVPRSVTCSKNDDDEQIQCTQVLVLYDSYVNFKSYTIHVKIAPGHEASADFIKTVDFLFTYENLKFAVWNIRLSYMWLGISILATLYWFYVCKVDQIRYMSTRDVEETSLSAHHRPGCCCSNGSCPYRTPPQRWVIFLLIALMGYNDPFHAMEYVESYGWRLFFEVVSVGLQLFFVCALFLFWLVTFETLYKAPPFGKLFYVPKFLFMLSFWIGAMVFYGRIISSRVHDRLYDWYEDKSLTFPLSIFLIVYGLVFMFWFVFVILRASGHIVSLTGGGKLVMFGHFLRMLIVLSGIILGAIFAEDPRYTKFTFFYQFTLNLYILELVYLFSPVSTSPVMFDEANGLGAVEEGTGSSGASIRATNTAAVSPRRKYSGATFEVEKQGTTTVNLSHV